MQKKYKWDKKYLYWGITLFLVVVASIVFFWILKQWGELKVGISVVLNVLSPVIFGLFFAYLFNKLMTFFESRFLLRLGARVFPDKPGKAKMLSRILGIVLSILCVFVVVGGCLALILPQLYQSIQSIATNIPVYYTEITGWAAKFLENNPELNTAIVNLVGNISEALSTWIKESVLPQAQLLITNITNGVISVVRVIFNILVGVIVSVYILYHKEVFSAQCKKVIYGIFKPRISNKILHAVNFVDKTCGGFVTGKLIDSLIIGVICYVVLILLNMPFAALVSVIICVTNIIPFFGPIIGAVPCALLILLENPVKCLVFIIFIIILQQLDGNFIGPKILGNSLGLSGFWIMFAILFFGGLFGFWGMLFGVPLFAVIYAFVRHYNTNQLKQRELPVDTYVYRSIEYIDPETNTPVFKKPESMEPGVSKTKSGKKSVRRDKKPKSGGSDDKKGD